jgi:hypothetical protein
VNAYADNTVPHPRWDLMAEAKHEREAADTRRPKRPRKRPSRRFLRKRNFLKIAA